MDQDTFELLQRRLTDNVRESVERDLKRRYSWLAVIILTVTGGTVTLLVNSMLSEARLKLETAQAVQELSTNRISEAAINAEKLQGVTEILVHEFRNRIGELRGDLGDISAHANEVNVGVKDWAKGQAEILERLRKDLDGINRIVADLVSANITNSRVEKSGVSHLFYGARGLCDGISRWTDQPRYLMAW